jgi:transcription antitermination protein NusB
VNYKARHKARIFAMQALYQWVHTGETVAALNAQFRTRNDYHKYVDWELFERLLTGATFEVNTVDELILTGARRPLKEINPVELALLRVAIFELKECVETPYQVVLSEYVDISSEFGSSEAHQFVNATLEHLARSLRPLEYQGGDKHERHQSKQT